MKKKAAIVVLALTMLTPASDKGSTAQENELRPVAYLPVVHRGIVYQDTDDFECWEDMWKPPWCLDW